MIKCRAIIMLVDAARIGEPAEVARQFAENKQAARQQLFPAIPTSTSLTTTPITMQTLPGDDQNGPPKTSVNAIHLADEQSPSAGPCVCGTVATNLASSSSSSTRLAPSQPDAEQRRKWQLSPMMTTAEDRRSHRIVCCPIGLERFPPPTIEAGSLLTIKPSNLCSCCILASRHHLGFSRLSWQATSGSAGGFGSGGENDFKQHGVLQNIQLRESLCGGRVCLGLLGGYLSPLVVVVVVVVVIVVRNERQYATNPTKHCQLYGIEKNYCRARRIRSIDYPSYCRQRQQRLNSLIEANSSSIKIEAEKVESKTGSGSAKEDENLLRIERKFYQNFRTNPSLYNANNNNNNSPMPPTTLCSIESNTMKKLKLMQIIAKYKPHVKIKRLRAALLFINDDDKFKSIELRSRPRVNLPPSLVVHITQSVPQLEQKQQKSGKQIAKRKRKSTIIPSGPPKAISLITAHYYGHCPKIANTYDNEVNNIRQPNHSRTMDNNTMPPACSQRLHPKPPGGMLVQLSCRPWLAAPTSVGNLKQQRQCLLKCLPWALLIWLLLAQLIFNRPPGSGGGRSGSEFLTSTASPGSMATGGLLNHLLPLKLISCSSIPDDFELPASPFNHHQQQHQLNMASGRKIVRVNSTRLRAAVKMRRPEKAEVVADGEEEEEDEDEAMVTETGPGLGRGNILMKRGRRSVVVGGPTEQHKNATTVVSGQSDHGEPGNESQANLNRDQSDTYDNLVVKNLTRSGGHKYELRHKTTTRPDGAETMKIISSTPSAASRLATINYRWPFVGLVSFIFIGATGNILVCAAVWRERRLQTATNYFLLSLAVADLLVCTLVMPFGIIYEFYGQWPFDWRICNLWVTWDVLTCSSSILHMCFISVGRYLGIRNPLHARQTNLFVSRRAVLWRIALAWTTAALIASPLTMMSLYDHRNIVPSETECAISNKYFLIFGSMLAFFIPMFVMVWSYVMTVRLLSRRAKYVSNTGLLLTGSSSTSQGLLDGQKMLDGADGANCHLPAQQRALLTRRSSGGEPAINSPPSGMQLNVLSSSSSLMQFRNRLGTARGRRPDGGSRSSSTSGCSVGQGGQFDERPSHSIVPWKRSKVISTPSGQQHTQSLQPEARVSGPGAGTAAACKQTNSNADVATTNDDEDDDDEGSSNSGHATGSGKPLAWLEEAAAAEENCNNRGDGRGGGRQSATKVADLFARIHYGSHQRGGDSGSGRPASGRPNRFEGPTTIQAKPAAEPTINCVSTTSSASCGNQHRGRRVDDNPDERLLLMLAKMGPPPPPPPPPPEMPLDGQILSATRFIDDDAADDDSDLSYLHSSSQRKQQLTSSRGSNNDGSGICLKMGPSSNLSIVSQRVMEGEANRASGAPLMMDSGGGGGFARLKSHHHHVNHPCDDMLPCPSISGSSSSNGRRCRHRRCCPERIVSKFGAGSSPIAQQRQRQRRADSRQSPEAEAANWKMEPPKRQSHNIEGLVDGAPATPLTSSNLSLATYLGQGSFNHQHPDDQGHEMTRKFSLSTSLLPDETCSGRFSLKSAACQQKRLDDNHRSDAQFPVINITFIDSLKLDNTRPQPTFLGQSTTSGSSCSCCRCHMTKSSEGKTHAAKSGADGTADDARAKVRLDSGPRSSSAPWNDDCCRCRRRRTTARLLGASGGCAGQVAAQSDHIGGREDDQAHHHDGHKHHHRRHRHRKHHHRHRHHHHRHHDDHHHKHKGHKHHHHDCKHHKRQPDEIDGQLNPIPRSRKKQHDDKSHPSPERQVADKSRQQRHLLADKRSSSEKPQKSPEVDGMAGGVGVGGPPPAVVACNRGRSATFGSSIMVAAMAALPSVLSSAVAVPRRRSTLADFGSGSGGGSNDGPIRANKGASLTTSGSNTTAGSGSLQQQGGATSGGSNPMGQPDTNNNNNNTNHNNNDEPQMIRYLGSSMQVRSEQKATKVLGVVFFTFVICWSPFFVINFTQAFVERKQLAKWISNEMMTTFLWLGYISSTINPVIYTVFNRNFRNAFRQILLCQPPSNQFGSLHQSRASEMNRAAFRVSQTKQTNRSSTQSNGPFSQNPATISRPGGHHGRGISNSMSLDGGGRKGPSFGGMGGKAGAMHRPFLVASDHQHHHHHHHHNHRPNQIHQSQDMHASRTNELEQINQALLADETIPEELVASTGGSGHSNCHETNRAREQEPTTAAPNWTGKLKSALKSSSDLITSLSGAGGGGSNRQSAGLDQQTTTRGHSQAKRTRFQY